MTGGFSFSEVCSFYYTPEQIHILQNLTIGIAGAGGIGSNCATLLVRSGFVRFVIADFDQVSHSNLNRQAYTARHIGKTKVTCLEMICRDINPAISMATHAVRIDRDNTRAIFNDCAIVIEAFDDPSAKAVLFSELLTSGKLLVGVSGIAGTGNSDAIVVREIRPGCFIVGDAVSAVSDTARPYAPRVMAAAAKMADIVLDRALRAEHPHIERITPQ